MVRIILLASLFIIIGCSDYIRLGKVDVVPGATQSSWQATLPLAFRSAQPTAPLNASESAIATNNTGDALLVWIQNNGLGMHVYKSEYRNGVWEHPKSLEDFISPIGGSYENLKVKLADNGDALIAFRKSVWSFPMGKTALYKVERRNNAWSFANSLFNAFQPMSDWYYHYDLAMAPNGDSVLLWWTDELGTPFNKVEYRSGAWEPSSTLPFPVALEPYNGDEVIDVEMNDTYSLIAWYSGDAVFMAERQSPGNWVWPSSVLDKVSPNNGPAAMYNYNSPQIAISSNGDALLAWTARTSGAHLYLVERRGGVWSTLANSDSFFNIADPDANVLNFSLAINDIGESVVAWIQPVGFLGPQQVYASVYRIPGGWSHPTDIADTFSVPGQNSFRPVVSISNGPSGRALLTWSENDGSNNLLRYSEYQGSWSPSQRASVLGQDVYLPTNRILSDGSSIISWVIPNAAFQVSYQAANGTWTHPSSELDSPSPSVIQISEYDFSLNNQGRAIVAWSQFDNDLCHIMTSEFDGKKWNHPDNLSEAIWIGPNCYPLKVAMDDKNDAIIVWRLVDEDPISYVNNRYYIMKAERRNGVWATTPNYTSISPEEYEVGGINVKMSSNGDAFISWAQKQGFVAFGESHVYYSHYIKDSGWVHPADLNTRLSPNPGNNTSDADIFVNDNGDAIFKWSQSDGSDPQVFVASYKKSTNSWSKPLTINDHLNVSGLQPNSSELAFNNKGDAVYFGIQLDSGNTWQIYKREFISGVWDSVSTPIGHFSSASGNGVSSVSVALNDSGEAVVAWNEERAGDIVLFKSEKIAGVWSAPEMIGTPQTNPEWISTAATGNKKMIFWKEGTFNIKGQIRSDDESWENLHFVSDYVDYFKLRCNSKEVCLIIYPSQITSTERNIGLNMKFFN